MHVEKISMTIQKFKHLYQEIEYSLVKRPP